MIRIISKTRAMASVSETQRGLDRLLRLHRLTTTTTPEQISKEKLFSTTPKILAQNPPTISPQPVAYPTEDDAVSGRSLLASHFIPEGFEIMAETFKVGSERILKRPSRFSLRKEDGVHLDPESIIRFTNHSFKPNARILFTTTDDATPNHHHRMVLQSITAIEEGKEITIDYTQTERVMAEPFVDIKTLKRVGMNSVEKEA